jgi:hypothetical protein
LQKSKEVPLHGIAMDASGPYLNILIFSKRV